MILSTKYRIIKEENNTILQFFEKRVKTKLDNTKEVYIFTENYYYPNLATALKAYVGKEIGECNDIKSVLFKLGELEAKLINNK